MGTQRNTVARIEVYSTEDSDFPWGEFTTPGSGIWFGLDDVPTTEDIREALEALANACVKSAGWEVGS